MPLKIRIIWRAWYGRHNFFFHNLMPFQQTSVNHLINFTSKSNAINHPVNHIHIPASRFMCESRPYTSNLLARRCLRSTQMQTQRITRPHNHIIFRQATKNDAHSRIFVPIVSHAKRTNSPHWFMHTFHTYIDIYIYTRKPALLRCAQHENINSRIIQNNHDGGRYTPHTFFINTIYTPVSIAPTHILKWIWRTRWRKNKTKRRRLEKIKNAKKSCLRNGFPSVRVWFPLTHGLPYICTCEHKQVCRLDTHILEPTHVFQRPRRHARASFAHLMPNRKTKWIAMYRRRCTYIQCISPQCRDMRTTRLGHSGSTI